MTTEEGPLDLLAVVGPTASGKTGLAIQLAEALGGEVINADSVQVYRHFDIGAGKPTAAELGDIPHHLLSFRDPFEVLEASQFQQYADLAIRDIQGRGKVPIVCGGTFLWMKALLYGLADAPPGDAVVRERHQALVTERGPAALHALLAAADPVSAARLHPNDVLRVSRALEVFEISGRRLSDSQGAHGFRERRYRTLLLGVGGSREAYEVRLRARTEALFAAGFIEEVEQLIAKGYGSARAMESVGYSQVHEALSSGAFDRTELMESVHRATRVFARRQRTWLKSEAVQWIEPEWLNNLPSDFTNHLRARLRPE